MHFADDRSDFYSLLNELVAQGCSTREIGRRLNKSQTSVRYWLSKFCIETERSETLSACASSPQEKEYSCAEHGSMLFRRYSDGKGYRYRCPKCINAKTVDRRKRLKQEYVNLLGGSCEECNYDRYTGALHFHHLSDKSFQLSRYMHSRSRQVVLEELDKCILLCSNCHLRKHSNLGEGLFYDASHKSARIRRITLINSFGGACCICENNDLATLTFHHIEPIDKQFGLHGKSGFNRKAEVVLNEAHKCALLCSNCHCEVEAGLHPEKEETWKASYPLIDLSLEAWLTDLVSYRSSLSNLMLLPA